MQSIASVLAPLNNDPFLPIRELAEAVMGYYPVINTVANSPAGAEISVAGKMMLNFCSCQRESIDSIHANGQSHQGATSKTR